MVTADLGVHMSDRSEDVTGSRDGPATDDLLEETDRLLSETGVDAGDDPVASDASRGRSTDPIGSPDEDVRDAGPASDAERDDASSGGRLSSLASRLSLGRYFSPKAYLALVLAVGAGLLAGSTALPIAGRPIGVFAVAFVVGLVGSKRRYLEMGAAGVSVGAVAAVLSEAVLVAAGLGQSLVAVGATVGLVASVVGYYFGRDLRDGLSRDVP
jgi:hypothetical protein